MSTLSDETSLPVEARVARVLREDIRALKAYHVPPAAGMVKLDAMENPYRLPQWLREALAQDLRAIVQHGYHVGTVVPIDMFPHSPHIEAVVTLTR